MTSAPFATAMSTELECLTCLVDSRVPADILMNRFFESMTESAPTLRATSGIFNGYGRVYIDCGHLEIAACECGSPYILPGIVERQQALIQRTVEKLDAEGLRLLLANNNHSGLLESNCATWVAHENYLVAKHPSQFGDLILPFLETRVYGGSGGIEYPTGNFLAAVRPVRMELPTGGGTTESRAIHSTAREEHHMGPSPRFFRYHCILGDGHRSHFNLAVQFAATSLALQAVISDSKLANDVRKMNRRLHGANSLRTLKQLNVLATPGKPLAVAPLITETQRTYLAAAKRFADGLPDQPEWIPRGLRDWEQTLVAMEELDLDWLSARLDTFTKYRFYRALLERKGKTWEELPGDEILFHELALQDHSYHEFCNPDSIFAQLERAEVLDHRVADRLEPGEEREPFVPETDTRATARARFIRDHRNDKRLFVDWACVRDVKRERLKWICDPFANKFDAWTRVADRGSLSLLERLEAARR